VSSRSRGRPFIYLIILVAVVFLVYSFYSQRAQDVTRTPLTKVAKLIRDGEVASIRVEGDGLPVRLADAREIMSHKGFESTVIEQL